MARPRSIGLTPRQEEALRAIRNFIAHRGFPPTIRDLADAMGITSSTAFYLLGELRQKGHVRHDPSRVRSLTIGEDSEPDCGCEAVPVMGMIAAGGPIEALEDRTGTITVERKLLRGAKAFALRVAGQSMVEAGILDGDYVVIRKQAAADDGDIVVALIENDATLKRFYREGRRVRLEPANRTMHPIFVKAGDFRIQGKVVGVVRRMTANK